MAPKKDASATQPRSLFPAADRIRILQQVIGKPTGTKVTVGGVDFDLVPLTIAQGDEMTYLIGRIGHIRSTDDLTAIMETAGTDGPRITKLLRDILLASAFVDRGSDDEALFDDWFGCLPIIETLRTMLPKVLEANGMTAMQKKPEPAATPEAETTSP